jgi:hypothetical protein
MQLPLKITVSILLLLGVSAFGQKKSTELVSPVISLTTDELKNKIKGGWAGQTIGVTFGGPTEFRYNGTFIQDYQPIVWYDGYLKKTMTENPDLYDDIYMDLTFVEVLDRVGLDAPVDSFAHAFAQAGYNLWHANQAARYNILNGINPPQSGHWLNNPHADDIDFQIEADFAGLMTPGMPNAAITIGDKIGHIMNYGDGWYGGVYVGAMYSLAFTSTDISSIVNQALIAIPPKSQFYQCIADVIAWHKMYPTDWKRTWMEIQKKWSEDIGCPEGTFAALDIDAKLNAAYIVLGLLYGEGDFRKTLEIATRAGQDSDCNPSSAGGILGTMLGYEKIPAFFKMGLSEVEDMPFKHTSTSLNKVYSISYKHALEMIKRNGGQVVGNTVRIKRIPIKTVRFEKSFAGLFPIARIPFSQGIGKTEFSFDFTGTGFALRGVAAKKRTDLPETTLEADVYIDGIKQETVRLPTSFLTRRYDLCWKYELPNKEHSVRVVVKTPSANYELRTWDYIVYSDKPAELQTSKID